MGWVSISLFITGLGQDRKKVNRSRWEGNHINNRSIITVYKYAVPAGTGVEREIGTGHVFLLLCHGIGTGQEYFCGMGQS